MKTMTTLIGACFGGVGAPVGGAIGGGCGGDWLGGKADEHTARAAMQKMAAAAAPWAQDAGPEGLPSTEAGTE